MTVIFHMNTRTTQDKRCWDKFHLLGEWFAKKGWEIVITGQEQDRAYCWSIIDKMNAYGLVSDYIGRTNLDQLVALLKSCDLLVSVNTFIMHLGVALDIPMIAIVGATDPKVILPPHIPRVYSEYAKDVSLCDVIAEIEKIV